MGIMKKTEKENIALLEDNITRSHFELSGFISAISGRTQRFEKLKSELIESNVIPTTFTKDTVLDEKDYLAIVDYMEKSKLIPQPVLEKIQEKGKESYVKNITERNSKTYDKIVSGGIQPIMVSDDRFNLLHKMIGDKMVYARTIEGKPYEKTPYIKGDILSSSETEQKILSDLKPHEAQLMITNDAINSPSIDTDKTEKSIMMISPYFTTAEQFQKSNGLVDNSLDEIRTLRSQLANGSSVLLNSARSFVNDLRDKNAKRSAERKNSSKQKTRSASTSLSTFKTNISDFNISPKANNKEVVEAYLGGFFSKADLAYLKKNILSEESTFSNEAYNRSRSLLEHLYDRGIEYEVSKNEKFKDQIVIRLADANKTTVRILDKNETYIGRVHTPMGDLFYADFQSRNGSSAWNSKDANALLDYITGNSDSVVVPYIPKSKTTARLKIPGTTRQALYKPSLDRINSLIFKDRQDAENTLRDYIDTAGTIYREELLDDSEEGLTAELLEARTALQEELQAYEADLENKKALDAEFVIDEETKEVETNAIIDKYVVDGVGSYENGFNPAKIFSLNAKVRSFNINESMVTAMKYVRYDTNKLIGTEFGVNAIRDRLVKFDADSAVSVEKQDDPFLKKMQEHVQNELFKSGVVGFNRDFSINEKEKPHVVIDKNGIIEWQGFRQSGRGTKEPEWKPVSTHIGQIFSPDKNGIVQTKFASGENYDFVPGYRGYFEYGDLEKSRMERFRGMGYTQILLERLTATVREQTLRPIGEETAKHIRYGADAVSLNKLYHGDVYGQRMEQNWYETSNLENEVKDKIIETLSGRIRFGEKYSENATTFTQVGVMNTGNGENIFSKTADGKNMRILDEDLANYVDLTMTGTNKNQGVVWYKANGAEFTDDGRLIPASEQFEKDGVTPIYAKAPLRELEYFDYSKFNAWDRNQMASNQLMTAYHVDKCRTALMTFGGWTFDDSYVVSKEFSDRNLVPDAETGELRPLKRGDKISDFGGNKGTIGMIIDRNMSAEEAEKAGLTREVGILRNNPDLDVIGSPYSMLSRHNAGVVLELQGEKAIDANGKEYYPNVKPVLDENGNPIPGCESGEINMIVTDMLTDKKSHAYTENDIAEGKGRSVSSQIVWALTEHGAKNMIKETFGRNDSSWATYREYLIAVGYDLGADGQLKSEYTPHSVEVRNEFFIDKDVPPTRFMKKVLSKGGMLNLPFDIALTSGSQTSKLPILSSSARSNTELLNGEMKLNSYTKDYVEVYANAREYMNLIDEKAKFEIEAKEEGLDAKTYEEKMKDFNVKLALPGDKDFNSHKSLQGIAQASVNRIQESIIHDRLGGRTGENSKYSFLRTKLMSKRAHNSATGVATVNPQLPLDTVAVSPEIYEVLDLKEKDEQIAIWRDPALRSGAIRGMKVVVDENISGMSIHPAVDKSFDADFDGDTFGLKKFYTQASQREITNNLAMKNNLLDPGTEVDTSYLNLSMDIVSGAIKAGIVEPYKEDIQIETDKDGNEIKVDKGEGKPKRDLVNLLTKIAVEKSPEEALALTTNIMNQSLRNNFGDAHVSLRSKEAMMQSMFDMSNDGAKGKKKSALEFENHYDGKKTLARDRQVQHASGTKSDVTGLAGSFSQRLMSIMRDVDSKVALESTYVITQGVLQIKHDAEKGVRLSQILSQDLQNLLDGKKRQARYGGPKSDQYLSVNEFKKEMKDIYNNQLDVPLRDDYLDSLADALTDPTNPTFIAGMNKTKARVASPMDQIAYGGGLAMIDKMAKEGRGFNEGEFSKLMLPKTMLEADENTILAKKDTQNIEARSDRENELKEIEKQKEAEIERKRQEAINNDIFGQNVFNEPELPPQQNISNDVEEEKEEDNVATL